MCCKDCTNRHPKCHSSCEEYLLYREQVDKRKEEYLFQKDIDRGHYEVVFNHYNKRKRKAQRSR